MANATVRVPPDSSGKRIDCSQLSIFGDIVQRQRVVLADPSSPTGAVLVENGALNVSVQSGLVLGRSAGDDGEARLSPRSSFDSNVQLPPDSTGKKLDCSAITVGADLVQRQRIVLADSSDPVGLVTVSGGALNVNVVRLGGNFLSVLTPANGDVLTFDASSNRWVSRQPVAVAPPSFNFMDAEVVTGGNTSWTLLYPPDPVTSLQLFQSVPGTGNILLRLGVDYTIASNAITTVASITPGSLTAWYRYSASAPPPPPAPTIESISPTSGPTAGGTVVTITGTNFAIGATVMFGSTVATSTTLVNATTITATSPSRAAGAVNVTVTSSGQSAVLLNAFTYLAPPMPTVTAVSPNIGTTLGGTAVTITGTNFAAGASVTFGGTAATSIVVANATTITCNTPARAAGAVTVAVTVGGQTGSLPNGFTYASTAPTVSAVSPNSGSTAGGTSVTITGTNFASGATVQFGSAAATNVTVSSATSITATTPAGSAGTVTVTVTSSGQSGNMPSAFTYIAPPTVTAVSPISGPLAGSTNVTITGTGFASGASVMFGANAATNVNVVSATSITCTTPAGSAGAVTVTVTNSNGLSGNRTSGFTYAAAPTVTSVTPNSGSTVGGIVITITGTNFFAGATVTVGGVSATAVSVVNATTITATVPAGTAGLATIVVNVSGQSGSLSGAFNYVLMAQGVYGGIGEQGATASVTLTSVTVATLSNGTALDQLKTTAEAVGDTWEFFNLEDECVYLLVTGGARLFQDRNGFRFAFDPPLTVTISGQTMYLYASKNPLYGNALVKVES